MRRASPSVFPLFSMPHPEGDAARWQLIVQAQFEALQQLARGQDQNTNSSQEARAGLRNALQEARNGLDEIELARDRVVGMGRGAELRIPDVADLGFGAGLAVVADPPPTTIVRQRIAPLAGTIA